MPDNETMELSIPRFQGLMSPEVQSPWNHTSIAMESTARPSFIVKCSKRLFNHLPRKICYDNALWYLETGRCHRGAQFTNGINYSVLLNRDYRVELIQLVHEKQTPIWCHLISSLKVTFLCSSYFLETLWKKPLCVEGVRTY